MESRGSSEAVSVDPVLSQPDPHAQAQFLPGSSQVTEKRLQLAPRHAFLLSMWGNGSGVALLLHSMVHP